MISAAIFDLSCVPALNHNPLLERANPVLAGKRNTFQNLGKLCSEFSPNPERSSQEKSDRRTVGIGQL